MSDKCKSCGETNDSLSNNKETNDYCIACNFRRECCICGRATSRSKGADVCICQQIYCNNCINKSSELSHVKCCKAIYCERSSYCSTNVCGFCNKCKECQRKLNINHMKDCATINCHNRICSKCCKEEYTTNLRYCKKCLAINQEFDILTINDQLKPGSIGVEVLKQAFYDRIAEFEP